MNYSYLIKVRISETDLAKDVALGALKDLFGRPDRVVANGTLHRGQDDGHFG